MTLATFSRGIRTIPIVEEALGQRVVSANSLASNDSVISGFVGWGRKSSGHKARTAAADKSKSVIFLEDGFIAYWGHPSGNSIRLSLNVDRQGIYYDASQPSDLEAMLSDGAEPDAAGIDRARMLRQLIVQNRLSKYNHHENDILPKNLSAALLSADKVCLVVDQTAGDSSISCGLAKAQAFSEMLKAAVNENPDALIIVKTHPDVIAGTKSSAIGPIKNNSQVLWISDDVHPHALIEAVDRVYVVTSQLGFEALLFKKPVVCFGTPFYAGWGLTDDRGTIPSRRGIPVSLEKLIYDSLIRYPVYVHPDKGKKCSPEDIVEWLCRQKRAAVEKYDTLLAVDFSLWKKAWLRAFTRDFVKELKFVSRNKIAQFDKTLPLLVWGARNAEKLRKSFPNRVLFTMEDGFVRSAGLGTDLKRPSSLIIDKRGIYYDCRKPSDLEHLLNNTDLSQRQRQEGAEVIRKLIDSGTTKYNVGDSLENDLCLYIEEQKLKGIPVILVPGQVEGDASIEFGSPQCKTNADLLQKVRNDFTDACIVYKPHPDIVARNRNNKHSFDREGVFADHIITDVNISLLYPLVDRVCTMTSLSGFEALIRGIKVTVYGLPFYAGWGLTEDKLFIKRRSASLSIEEFAYISLVAYPRYVNWDTWMFCSLATILEQLESRVSVRSGSNSIIRLFRKIAYFLESLRRV